MAGYTAENLSDYKEVDINNLVVFSINSFDHNFKYEIIQGCSKSTGRKLLQDILKLVERKALVILNFISEDFYL